MEKQLPRVSVAFLVTTLLLIAGSKTEAQVKQTVGIKTLTLGVAYQSEPKSVAEHFRPLVQYVADKLGPAGDIKGSVVVADNTARLIELLEQGQVDFYLESPFPTYLVNRTGKGKLLLRRWKGGMAEYRGVILASKASRITRLEDLRGKMIAFEDPGSTSGYFLPKLLLFEKRFRVTEKPDLSAKVSTAEIGYIFAGSEDEALIWRPGSRNALGGSGPSFAMQDRVEIGDRQAGITYEANGWQASFAYVEREIRVRAGGRNFNQDEDFTGLTLTMRH